MLFLDTSTWEETFQELIQQEKPWAKWTLKLDKNIVPDGGALGWKQYQQTVLGRFQCSMCNRSWTSAQVKILCHMYWNPWNSQGQVLMRIFAQRCQKCSYSQFENPEFSKENVTKILQNLVEYILQRYYGHGFRKMPKTRKVHLEEEVPLDGPHDKSNCEACTLGYHVIGSRKHEAKSSLPPSPPPSLTTCSYSSQFGNLLYEEPGECQSQGQWLLIFFLLIFALIFGEVFRR